MDYDFYTIRKVGTNNLSITVPSAFAKLNNVVAGNAARIISDGTKLIIEFDRSKFYPA